MGSIICTAGFPSAAISASCFTARCDSTWYGFFIATLLFSAKENSLSAYQGCERGVATFYDLPGISSFAGLTFENGEDLGGTQLSRSFFPERAKRFHMCRSVSLEIARQ